MNPPLLSPRSWASPARPRLSLSTEANPILGEAIFVEADHLVDRRVGRQMLIFVIEPPVEPAGQVAQRLAYILFGVSRHILDDGAVALDDNVHAIFVIIATAMANARAKLIEVSALNRAKGIGDAMKVDRKSTRLEYRY